MKPCLLAGGELESVLWERPINLAPKADLKRRRRGARGLALEGPRARTRAACQWAYPGSLVSTPLPKVLFWPVLTVVFLLNLKSLNGFYAVAGEEKSVKFISIIRWVLRRLIAAGRATTISVHSIFYVWRDIYLSESSCPSLGSTLQGILASCPGRSVALGSLGPGRGTKKC